MAQNLKTATKSNDLTAFLNNRIREFFKKQGQAVEQLKEIRNDYQTLLNKLADQK